MKELKAKDIISTMGGTWITGDPETRLTGVSTDTRTLVAGMLFFALEGPRYDGHNFLNQAIDGGASVLVISKEVGSATALAENRGVAVIRVPDTMVALKNLATDYLSQFPIPKIGVTGSTGKTTTKEMLYWILSERYHTHRNAGNFNNLVGLPLSAFEMDDSTEVAVFEMGMDRLGEIHALAEIVKPSIGLITNVGVSHLEHLKTRQNILKAKMELTDFMETGDVLIINKDNDMLATLEQNGSYTILPVGRSEDSVCQITDLEDLGEEGIRFALNLDGEKGFFRISAPGLHNAANASLAITAALRLGVTWEEAARGLAKLAYTDKRLHIAEKKGVKIIDDTYNASPDSMKAALDVLISVEGKRKIAILGDMFELGEKSLDYHREVGEYASKTGVDVVISVGKNARMIQEGANSGHTKSIHFETKEFLFSVLSQWIRSGDVILIKGSRGMAMDEIVKQLDGLPL